MSTQLGSKKELQKIKKTFQTKVTLIRKKQKQILNKLKSATADQQLTNIRHKIKDSQL